jgi:putative transposase
VCWGYRRLHVLLRREGVVVNKKCVYRIYRKEGLAVRRRKRKRVAVARQPLPAPTRLNEGWGMDFVSDVLRGGRRFRILNVLDLLSREGLASEVDTSLPAKRVVRTLDEIAVERGSLNNRTPSEFARRLQTRDSGVRVARDRGCTGDLRSRSRAARG